MCTYISVSCRNKHSTDCSSQALALRGVHVAPTEPETLQLMGIETNFQLGIVHFSSSCFSGSMGKEKLWLHGNVTVVTVQTIRYICCLPKSLSDCIDLQSKCPQWWLAWMDVKTLWQPSKCSLTIYINSLSIVSDQSELHMVQLPASESYWFSP